MAVTFTARFIQAILMSPFRNQKLVVQEIKIWKWAVLGSIEFYAGYLFYKQQKWNVTTAIFLIDVITLCFQFFYHREYIREQRGEKPGLFSLLMTERFYTFERAQGIDDETHLARFIQAKFKQHNSKTETEKFKEKEIKVQKDIYSLAYAAIMHPAECEKKEGYMPQIDLLSEERTSLFVSAMLVALVQVTTIMLIMIYFGKTEKGSAVKIIPAQSYFVLIPRLISSIMMHLNVEPDIRQGIELMKYTVNHP